MELKETLLYWIHCNRCFEIYTWKQRKVYLLSCQHISCENCINRVEGENDIYNCPICKNKVTGRLMCNSLPPQIKELFHPQPWLDRLPSSHILRFQQPHRTHFEKGMQRLSREVERLEKSILQLREIAKKKFEEFENSRYERRQLDKRALKMSKQLKLKLEQRARREAELRNKAASTISSVPVVTADSGIEINAHLQRHSIVSQGATISARSALNVNALGFQNPNKFSFKNFAYRDTANFTL